MWDLAEFRAAVGPLRVAQRVPAHGARAGPADKITWVPCGNPVRDLHIFHMAGTLTGYPAGNLRAARRVPAHGAHAGPADKIARVPRGNPIRDPRIHDTAGTLAGYPAGNLWVSRRVPAHGVTELGIGPLHFFHTVLYGICLLYTSPSPRD